MSLANPNANVTLSFEGLAIYNLNKSSNFWEFLFLRHLKNHKLKIEIIQYLNGTKFVHSLAIEKEHNIFIDAPKAVEPLNGNMYKIDNFSYGTNEEEDIRWMDELPESEDVGLTSCSFRNDFLKKDLAFLSINGESILYTKILSKEKFEIWENIGIKDQVGYTKRLVDSRKIGVVVAADIEYPSNETIKIRVEGKSDFTLELPITQDSIYEIKFNNSCDGLATSFDTSDFQHYYDLFSPTERKLEIISIPILDINGHKLDNTPACKCKTCKNLIGFDSLSEVGLL
jgi:hypothetical protein